MYLMGLLIDGKWSDDWYDTSKTGGRFVRDTAGYRHWITADGSAGPSGDAGFVAQSGRYHLYISHACPWAHRTMIFRHLKELTDHVSVSVVHPLMLEGGWRFDQDDAHTTSDHVLGKNFLHEVYTHCAPQASGRVTVPVLWDKHTGQIVSNESSEIIRMFNAAFNRVTGNDDDYWPVRLRDEIETINKDIYDNINNGVYKAGFATSAAAYEAAVMSLFAALDRLEARLQGQRYLLGRALTEADWRLFTTLVRFDPVYVGHFKCNLRRVADYPALYGYMRDLYQMPGIAATVVMDHIKAHYYQSHQQINPSGIVPKGPLLDYHSPHDRDQI
jgi:putative glutathione S-transferase